MKLCKVYLNIFKNFSGQTNKAYFEGKVNSLLNDTLKQTGNIGLENLDLERSLQQIWLILVQKVNYKILLKWLHA